MSRATLKNKIYTLKSPTGEEWQILTLEDALNEYKELEALTCAACPVCRGEIGVITTSIADREHNKRTIQSLKDEIVRITRLYEETYEHYAQNQKALFKINNLAVELQDQLFEKEKNG